MTGRRIAAFTLIEALTALAIIVIVASLLFPVLVSAKQATKIAKSKSNMRQIAQQTTLYQIDYDGIGKYGDSFEMGLPPMPSFERIPTQLTLLPPNSPNSRSPDVGKVYPALFIDPAMDGQTLTWSRYSQELYDGAVLYMDPFNNDPNLPLDNGAFIRRQLFGVSVSGSLIRIYDSGNWPERMWWFEHQRRK